MYQLTAIFIMIGITTNTIILDNLLKELYNLYRYSIVCNEFGILEKSSNTLVEWQNIKHIKEDDDFYI